MVQQCNKSTDRIRFLFSDATSVGATVSWLMANSGRLQTDRDRGVRESKDQVSFSSLSHIMSEGQWETPVEGGWGRRQPWVFRRHWGMCRHTHDRKVRQKTNPQQSLSCGSWNSFILDLTLLSLFGDLKQMSSYMALVYRQPHGPLMQSAVLVSEFTACTVRYYVLTSADIAGDLGVKVREGKGGWMDGWMDGWIGKWEVRGGVQAGTWVHRLLLINSLMGADRTCAAIK